jgi:hypothetical protein
MKIALVPFRFLYKKLSLNQLHFIIDFRIFQGRASLPVVDD